MMAYDPTEYCHFYIKHKLYHLNFWYNLGGTEGSTELMS